MKHGGAGVGGAWVVQSLSVGLLISAEVKISGSRDQALAHPGSVVHVLLLLLFTHPPLLSGLPGACASPQ